MADEQLYRMILDTWEDMVDKKSPARQIVADYIEEKYGDVDTWSISSDMEFLGRILPPEVWEDYNASHESRDEYENYQNEYRNTLYGRYWFDRVRQGLGYVIDELQRRRNQGYHYYRNLQEKDQDPLQDNKFIKSLRRKYSMKSISAQDQSILEGLVMAALHEEEGWEYMLRDWLEEHGVEKGGEKERVLGTIENEIEYIKYIIGQIKKDRKTKPNFEINKTIEITVGSVVRAIMGKLERNKGFTHV